MVIYPSWDLTLKTTPSLKIKYCPFIPSKVPVNSGDLVRFKLFTFNESDHDGDGIPTFQEFDVDGDGIADDTDGDGLNDYLDTD